MSLPVWSNTTAQEYPVQADQIKERLTDHLIKPVKFVDQVQGMYAAGARIFIEVGPGKVLSGLTKACLGKEELFMHAEDNSLNKLTHLLCMLATYISTGRDIHMEKLFEGRGARLLNFNEPALYKKNPAIWFVNGQHAIPSNGKLPANGALPIIEPIQMKNRELRSEPSQAAQSASDLMMQEYLNSMKLLIQAQRDVMLTFLGQHVPFNSGLGNPQAVLQQPVAAAVKAVAEQKDVKLALLQIVSDKTGYPQEMLGMEMDLEADLSIDSIKRLEIIGALRTELGGFSSTHSEDTVMEQLAGIKTLNGLVNWITENAVPAGTNSSATINIEVTVNNNQPKFSAEELRAVILSVVSEKTGYPEEMLGMDLDLEADLSIDSIKRMEIIGELKLKIGFSGGQDQGDDLMEKLAAIKTLNGLVNWISEIESGTDDVLTEAKKIIEESVTDNAGLEKLSRLRFELTPAALVDIEAAILKGQHFAITDDGHGQAIKIKNLFKKHGASVDIVSAGDDLQSYQGLIILNMFGTEKKALIIEHFEMIKQLNFEKAKWIYMISDVRTYLNDSTDVEMLRLYQGYSGFFKSLDREYENTKCRLVSLETLMSAEEIANVTLNEILNPDTPSEIIYHGNKRQIMELIPAELITGLEDSHIQLDKDAVVLVLGGAQGITAELMIHFAKDYPCNYILVGRSADPKSAVQGKAASLKTKDEIRSYLIQQGEIKKPAEIEQETARIYKNNQILNSIAMLESGGSNVVYESLDLRDEDGLSRFVDSVYQKYGRIDGVVHGAGLLEDKLFHSKTSASFERVFDTKVTPLRVLAEKLRPETQFVILFSSIASVYGNRGQTDYAAANSVMDRYAWALKQKINGKVLAINWGPWKGAGMVSPTLEKEYERRGIALIPLQDGMETFLNELKYGKESQVLIMAGNNW